jgi:hypothetical protein
MRAARFEFEFYFRIADCVDIQAGSKSFIRAVHSSFRRGILKLSELEVVVQEYYARYQISCGSDGAR